MCWPCPPNPSGTKRPRDRDLVVDVRRQRPLRSSVNGTGAQEHRVSRDATAAAPVVQLVREAPPKRLNFFERYLTLWVAACMAVGVVVGKTLPGAVSAL